MKPAYVLALLLASNPTWAAEATQAPSNTLISVQPLPTLPHEAVAFLSELSPRVRARLEPSKGGFDAHPLLDRLSQNLERSASTAEMTYLTWERFAGRDAEYASIAARRTVRRATESAFKKLLTDLVEEQTGIDPVVDAISAPRQPLPVERRFRYVVGVSQSLPRLDLRRSIGELSMNLSLGASGQMGIDLHGMHRTRAWFHGGYNVRTRTIDVRQLWRF